MIKLSKIKQIGVADSVEEVMMYKTYLQDQMGYDVNNVTFNMLANNKVEFTLVYNSNEEITALVTRIVK